MVVQQVANLKFHEVTNQVLTNAINAELITYETNSSIYYPFNIRIIGLNIQYPQKTLKANNTLGTKLLEQTSMLKQLNNKLDNLKKDYAKYETVAQNYQIKRVTIRRCRQLSTAKFATARTQSSWQAPSGLRASSCSTPQSATKPWSRNTCRSTSTVSTT